MAMFFTTSCASPPWAALPWSAPRSRPYLVSAASLSAASPSNEARWGPEGVHGLNQYCFFVCSVLLVFWFSLVFHDLAKVRSIIYIGSATDDTINSLYHAVTAEGKYPYLWDNGNWSTSKTVRNVFVMGSGGITSAITLFHNEFMTGATDTPAKVPGFGPRAKSTIGPELGIGFTLGQYTQEPVMTLKSCIGDRALGWDLLAPGSKGYEYTAPGSNQSYTYAGYHQSPMKWLTGTPPQPIGWAAGLQYDGDIYRANHVLSNLSTYFPSTPPNTCYEVAGFFW